MEKYKTYALIDLDDRPYHTGYNITIGNNPYKLFEKAKKYMTDYSSECNLLKVNIYNHEEISSHDEESLYDLVDVDLLDGDNLLEYFDIDDDIKNKENFIIYECEDAECKIAIKKKLPCIKNNINEKIYFHKDLGILINGNYLNKCHDISDLVPY